MVTTSIIETLEEFASFKRRFESDEPVIVLYLLSDTKRHPAVNQLSVFYCRFGNSGESCIIAPNHPDCIPIGIEELQSLVLTGPETFVLGKKNLLHVLPQFQSAIDVEFLQYLDTNSPLEGLDDLIPFNVKSLRQQFSAYRDVNKSVPIMKIIEHFNSLAIECKSIATKHLHNSQTKSFDFFNNVATQCLNEIERSGLYVNPDHFLTVLGDRFKGQLHDGFVYSEYNLLTSTGRCSNRFGGINFAALPKKDGARESFVSRFGSEGELVSIDYESFHLRLIAEIINFDLPLEPVHIYLGKQYFNTDTLTEEQYDQSKVKTFQFLYGGIKSPEMENLPYFKAVEEYTESLWKDMQIEGFIISPQYQKKIFLHHIENPNPTKIFNYVVQLFETEKNLTLLGKLFQEQAKNIQSKIILYTYDAILIDFHKSEQSYLSWFVSGLEQAGKYPVRVYRGENYQNLSLDSTK